MRDAGLNICYGTFENDLQIFGVPILRGVCQDLLHLICIGEELHGGFSSPGAE
jgi:hypothetical protein